MIRRRTLLDLIDYAAEAFADALIRHAEARGIVRAADGAPRKDEIAWRNADEEPGSLDPTKNAADGTSSRSRLMAKDVVRRLAAKAKPKR